MKIYVNLLYTRIYLPHIAPLSNHSRLIKVRGLSKTFEGKLLFDDTFFDVGTDTYIGLLGPDGCGKTTLFKILLGWERANTEETGQKRTKTTAK